MGTAHQIIDGRADARLRREMHEGIDGPPLEDALQERRVVNVQLVEVEVRAAGGVGNALFFDGPVVVGTEVVNRRDNVSLVHEATAEVPPDEPSSSRNKDVHPNGGKMM